jgi:hypothetical protein
VVFDDAIMDDGDIELLIEVRMGIFIGGLAVRCPAGVANCKA